MEKEKTKSYLVGMTPTLHEKAEKAAQRLGLNFSAYVRYLISKDTDKANTPS